MAESSEKEGSGNPLEEKITRREALLRAGKALGAVVGVTLGSSLISACDVLLYSKYCNGYHQNYTAQQSYCNYSNYSDTYSNATYSKYCNGNNMNYTSHYSYCNYSNYSDG